MFVFAASAQHPLKNSTDAVEIRFDIKQPVINYLLSIDSTDLTSFAVEMRLRNIPDTFHIAMVAHPEYDDRYWRFVKELRVETKNDKGSIMREDSALWQVTASGGEAVIYYRIHLPPQQHEQRAVWRPFLSATGGLIGGPHSFMYIVGATLAPSHITLKLPKSWEAVTGLEHTSDPYTFFAPSVGALTDAPILAGKLKSWNFEVDGVPHRVVYWPLPNAASFDLSALVASIQKFVQQASNLFGRLPYREYFFLLQDGAYGALEHCNSVTIGISLAELSRDFTDYLSEIAHEYFHAWNLMRIHPVEYGDVDYRTPKLSRGLWWSEGLTMFYADLLLRRAHLPVYDSSRIQHLEHLVSRYFGNPGNVLISPEKVSLAAYAPPGMLGDYEASTHLQGELLGAMLDLDIHNATNGKHSMDDAMRKMLERYSGEKGFISSDIEQVTEDVCGCNVHSFFENYVKGNKAIDFAKYLQLIGLHLNMSWKDLSDSAGKAIPDLRAYAWQSPGDSVVKLGITDPSGCWGKAGLHTGDKIISINKTAIKSRDDFWQLIGRLQIGDQLSIEVQWASGKWQTSFVVSGYKQPEVHIREIQKTSERQQKLYAAWISGE
jgi:predicted metalloprotease with PDZ domain